MLVKLVVMLACLCALFAVAPRAGVAQELDSRAAVRLPLEGAHEIDGAQFAFVEVSTASKVYFAEQPIHLTLRLGLELEFSKHNLIQLFTRTLDVPVQLEVGWIDGLPGALSRSDRTDARGEQVWATLVINEQVGHAVRVEDRQLDGRKFAVFEIERTYFAQANPRLALPAPRLRFATATHFEPNPIADPVPVDLQLASVTGKPLELDIELLPEKGRPLDFGGAIGQFEVSAEVDTRNPAVGESLKLTLRIDGEGNLELLQPPRLDSIAGFQLRGMLDDRNTRPRNVTYDLTPLATDVKQIPSIGFSFFDPGQPSGYRTLHTQPIELDVRPGPAKSAHSSKHSDEGPGAGLAAAGATWVLVLTGLAMILLCVGVPIAVVIRRRRRSVERKLARAEQINN